MTPGMCFTYEHMICSSDCTGTFTVPDFNFQICVSLSIKYSSASLLLDDEFVAKAEDQG